MEGRPLVKKGKMSWSCKHDWKKIKETYAPPFPFSCDSGSGEGLKELMERAACGLTTILWQCSKCQKIRKEEMLGKEVV